MPQPTTTTTTSTPHFFQMPTIKVRQWGKVDKQHLANLINEKKINITDAVVSQLYLAQYKGVFGAPDQGQMLYV